MYEGILYHNYMSFVIKQTWIEFTEHWIKFSVPYTNYIMININYRVCLCMFAFYCCLGVNMWMHIRVCVSEVLMDVFDLSPSLSAI